MFKLWNRFFFKHNLFPSSVWAVSFGILGKPLSQFSYSTLMPHGDKKVDAEADDRDSDLDEGEKVWEQVLSS